MILLKQIALEKFGKFANKVFVFGDLTVFCGANEAGKTTIFDAICKAIHDRFRNRGERLPAYYSSRYGSAQNVTAEWSEGCEKLHWESEEIFRLYAIREGDGRIDFDSKQKWLQQVMARLFAGGISPREVIRYLEFEYASDDKRRKRFREREAKGEALAKIEQEIQNIEAERSALLTAEAKLAADRTRIERLTDERRTLEEEIAGLDRELDRLRKIRQRAHYAARLRHLQSIEECRLELQSLVAFTAEQDGELAKRERQLVEAKQALALAEERLKQAAAEKQRVEGEGAEKMRALAAKKRLAEEAERLRLVISQQRPAQKMEVRWSAPLVILAIVVAVAGCAIAFAALSLIAALAVSAAMLMAAGGLVAASRRKEWQPDHAAETLLLMKIRDAWLNAGGSGDIGNFGTLDGMADFFARQIADFRSAAQAYCDLEGELRRREDELRRNEAAKQLAAENLQAAEKNFTVWLRGLGVGSVAEYVKKRDARKKKEALLAEHEKAVGKEALSDLAGAKSECLRHLQELDDETIPVAGRDEHDYNALERQRAEKERRKNALIDEITRLTSDASQGAGQIGERMAGLEKQLVDKKRERSRLEEAIAEFELDREAASQAIEIFETIAANHQMQFAALSNDIAALLEEALRQPRGVTIADLAKKECKCADAAGEMRDLDDLSRGTREIFYFAARLALAHTHAANAPRLVLLDEPFAALDEERERQMLALLVAFVEKYRWQAVIFTKERRLIAQLLAHLRIVIYEYADGAWRQREF